MPKASDKAPYFPFYVKDYETDEYIKMMSLAQEGAFLRLICHQWLHRSVPKSVEAMSRICRIGVEEFASIWPGIAPCFSDGDDVSRLVNRKLERLRKDTRTHSAEQSRKGKLSAAARAATKSQPDSNQTSTEGQPESNRGPTAQPTESQPSFALASAIANTQKETVCVPPKSSLPDHPTNAQLRQMPRLVDGPHVHHAFCGRMCMHTSQFRGFIRKLGGAEIDASKRISDWFAAVNAKYAAGAPIPQSNEFKFWDAEYDAKFGSARTKNEPTPHVLPSIDETARRGRALEEFGASLDKENQK